jgi:hypothetical protein
MRIISVSHSHPLWAARLATSLRFLFAGDITAKFIDVVMKLPGGRRRLSIRALPLGSSG